MIWLRLELAGARRLVSVESEFPRLPLVTYTTISCLLYHDIPALFLSYLAVFSTTHPLILFYVYHNSAK